MTKHDIRIRRGAFSKGQIERHKDFQKFSGLVERDRGGGFGQKFWVVLITVLFFLAIILFGYFKLKEDREDRKFKVPEIEQTEDNNKKSSTIN